jgi:hypothetical protein
MLSKFFEVLPVLVDGSNQVGVCAMGPIGDGDTLIWMRVWVWQQDGDDVAASAGNAGDHVPGAHTLSGDQVPPFVHGQDGQGKPKKWMVQTKLEPQSADFNLDKPALVQAMALVENAGDRSIVQWGQAVALRQPAHHPHDH